MASSQGADPFFSLKTEVEAAISDIMEGLPHLTPREVTEALERIKWDIEMMEDSIERVTSNPSKFGISSDEIERRRVFVNGMKTKLSSIQSKDNDKKTTSAAGIGISNARSSQSNQREALLGNREQEKAKQQAALEEDNENFIENENLRRALIMQEQDESLDDLSLAVTRIGHMGLTIHNELKEQESLIDDLHERTDFSVNNMSDVNKLVTEMLQNRQGRNQLCLICILTTALIVVTTLIFLLP
mmetsp:Transcript_7967/g.18172  ORF Transcript_7967/g.18172 Transcript_7967/m.18172 type:complete len:244 (-) Transcript_7967:38-769(-)